MSDEEQDENEEEEDEEEEEEEEAGIGAEGESLSRSALSDVEDGYEQSNSSIPNSDISTVSSNFHNQINCSHFMLVS